MPKVCFDTNIFIARPRVVLPPSFYFSVVVLQELVAGAVDRTNVKELNTTRIRYEKLGRMLVPNAEDWWLAGKIINTLQRDSKWKSGGKTPKLPEDRKHRLTHDVLIARTCRREGVLLVTDNLKDFEMIRPSCAAKTISGDDYFATLGI